MLKKEHSAMSFLFTIWNSFSIPHQKSF